MLRKSWSPKDNDIDILNLAAKILDFLARSFQRFVGIEPVF